MEEYNGKHNLMELKDLQTPSPNDIGRKGTLPSISQKDDTPFIKETELEEFNLVGANGHGLSSSHIVQRFEIEKTKSEENQAQSKYYWDFLIKYESHQRS